MAAVVSWLEELERREAAAGERAEGLRGRIAGLSQELAAEEELLSRLAITRKTMLDPGRACRPRRAGAGRGRWRVAGGGVAGAAAGAGSWG